MIGGGITGLVAAERLRSLGADVVLVEASKKLGGKISRVEIAGVAVEAGPDSFLARDPAMVELCVRLGLEDDLVGPHDFGAWLWRSGRLVRMPSGSFFGIPASVRAALASRVLSFPGALRAGRDLVMSGPLRGPDISVGELVRKRFGPQVLERLVDPILAGTRAGDVDSISLAAALPQLDGIARNHRSVMRGLRRARKEGRVESGTPPFLAPRTGMSAIVDALAEELKDCEVIVGDPVTALSRGRGWAVRMQSGSIRADALVLAVPAHVGARLLGEPCPAAAEKLQTIRAASVAIVVMAYPGDVRLPEGGSGLLVASSEPTTISGCTWLSRKWPHIETEHQIVRAFVGRSGDDPALRLDDSSLIERVRTDLTRMMDLPRETDATVVRWERGLPQYEVGHLEKLAEIRRSLKGLAVELAGASYEGSGLPDCVAQAERTANRLTE